MSFLNIVIVSEEGPTGIDPSSIKKNVEERLDDNQGEKTKESDKKHIYTGIGGFDELMSRGIPKGSPILLAGGAGSGKTIFALQTLIHHAREGKDCLFLSFEEPRENLRSHIRDFGWNEDDIIDSDNLVIKEQTPFEISRQVEAMLAKEKGELMIDIDPMIIPEGMDPDVVVIDSVTAIESTFTGGENSYRIYIEQLFRFFSERDITTFLITETEQNPDEFSPTGVEEFLADGVIVLYSIKNGNVRDHGIEILKMRGENHDRQMVAMRITEEGINVYPDQEVFSS